MLIKAIAHALPSRRVTNDDLLEIVAPDDREDRAAVEEARADISRYLESTGARARFHRGADDRAIDLGVSAARRSLDRGGVHPDELDLLIFVGVGRGFLEPATANVFQDALGLHRATCFDVMDACASWLRGMEVAHHMLQAGEYRCAMILNCECNFAEYSTPALRAGADFDEIVAGYTIGEAATATVVTRSSENREFYASFRNEGSRSSLCEIPLPSAEQFRVHAGTAARPPLRFTAKSRTLNAAATMALKRQFSDDSRLHGFDYDISFGHASSLPATRRVAKALGLDLEKHYEIFPEYGNTVSASIPLAMSLAYEEGRLNRGSRALLIVGSAGLTTAFGTIVF